MRLRPSAALLAVALAGFAGGAAGQPAETGGLRINGTLTTQTVVGGSSNLASGAGSRALTSVGSVDPGGPINGRVNVTVKTGYIGNVANGAGEQAVTDVGSIHPGAKLDGPTDVVVSTGQIINMSDHSGRPACVVVGSTGAVPGC
jgi:hypothetical protein